MKTIDVKIMGGYWEGDLIIVNANSITLGNAVWIPDGKERHTCGVSAIRLLIPFHLIVEPVRTK